MRAVELSKTFDPKEFEDRIYELWMKNKAFEPKGDSQENFVIVIPPPNVTGVLHMGHGLNNSLQDIVVRYHRMLGKRVLWVPGTDHAGIATQHVVEKRLKAQNKSRHDLGREKFVEETWKVKDEHHAVITKQLKKIGSSCDWSRERFTMDEGLSTAVREVFVTLFERGLIYKGDYLVNWCSSCTTALSDDEVEHKEVKGGLYHYRYPLTDGSGELVIATTRPETMLGDTAVAVHPEDPRYAGLIGKTVRLPLCNRDIPIIADAYVEKEFGTGVVKITPGHDPNDYEIGKRHELPLINILDDFGKLNANVPEKYRGMNVKQARAAVLTDLEEQGFFIKKDDHIHQVGHCYRCTTVIEPYLSSQWFVRMKPLAEKALKAWENGEIQFFPKRWENTYKHWLSNIRDWCISRQLWWGHRIPVWYCQDCGEQIVSRTDVQKCPKCFGAKIKQDEDVLDTWFSSWLWPFSTMGWPQDTQDLKDFYPTTVLITAYDIIFFWVSRMIMAGLEFTGQVPFRDIYIHQLVRDKQGRKMSKSLGNGIDPLEIVGQFGADSLKFTLAYMAAQGQDILIDNETFKLGSKFANKIWNATRFLLMNLEGCELLPKDKQDFKETDQWIVHRLNSAAKNVDDAMKGYRYNDAAHVLYEYFWNDFCDWYVEASKKSLYSADPAEKNRAISVLITVLTDSLKLLHPFLPFITEEIYQKLPGANGLIMLEPYPVFTKEKEATEINRLFSLLQDIVRSVRTLRSEYAVSPDKKIKIIIKTESGSSDIDFLNRYSGIMQSFMNCSELMITENQEATQNAVPVSGKGYQAFVFIREVIDIPAQIAKMQKELEAAIKTKKSTEGKLSNTDFVSRAPAEIVEKEKEKLAEFTAQILKLENAIAQLGTQE